MTLHILSWKFEKIIGKNEFRIIPEKRSFSISTNELIWVQQNAEPDQTL